MEIKYINNDRELGIEYDWRAIKKVYESLGVPEEYDLIPWKALSQDKYIMELSERSIGKTTCWLLLGCCMNKLYKTTIQYIRASENMLAPSHAEKLVEVLRSYKEGEYIRKLTDGKYNSISYHWKQFYYSNIDENGKLIERSEEPLIQCLSIDKCGDYKSSYNTYLSRGDFVVFDEFIGTYYRPLEAINFFDLLKTIFRNRISGVVIMLANTINLNSQYFEEFEISRAVKQLHKGDKREIVTERGTRIYIEILDVKRTSSKRSLMNELFFGFKNPRLSAITGGEVWAFDSVPHIPPKSEQIGRRCILYNVYAEIGLELLKIELVEDDKLGAHLEIHRASKIYDDSIVLTLGELKDRRYVYGFGTGRLNTILAKYINERKVLYSSNEVGSIFKDYIHRYKIERGAY